MIMMKVIIRMMLQKMLTIMMKMRIMRVVKIRRRKVPRDPGKIS